jgi:hypothetical protein
VTLPPQGRVEVLMMAMWLHQERGGSLGVCLTSTPKRLRDNKGVAFANQSWHLLWIVDLARVPGLVINLYGWPGGLRGVANRSFDGRQWREWSQEQARGHMLASVTKNRELFAQDIPASACKSVAIPPEWLNEVDWKSEQILHNAIQSFLP